MAQWTLARLERAVENFSAQLQCAICLCAYDSPVSLPCNHCFCEECIHRALELKAQCPICKTPAKKRRLRYDTTVQELLRATEILSGTSDAVKVEDKVVVKTPLEKSVEVKKMSKIAGVKVAATLERQQSPRRDKCNLKMNDTTLDVWMTGGYSQLSNGMKIKKEVSTPVVTSERTLIRRPMQQINSQMSPAIFEMTATSRGNGTAKRDEETLTRRRRSDIDEVGGKIATSCAVENRIRVEDSERKDAVAVDVIVAETQLEVVEQEQQIPTRRRSSRDAVTISNEAQVEPEQSKRLQSTRNYASTADVEVGQQMLQTPTPYPRRRSTTNDVTTDAAASKMLREVSVSNGKIAHTNGAAKTSALTVDSQTEPLSNIQCEVFQVGDVVEVIERQWVGINKQGGAARITEVCGDGFYAVKFVIGGKDNRVPGSFIRWPAEDLISDLTPSRSVKKRQRRRVSDKMISSDHLATKAIGSTDSISVKAKTKSKRKRPGMVFLCSGFKERRMRQIDKWADLLGAEVVPYWSYDVTHLIVKCVSEDDAEDEDPCMEDSDTTSSPQSYQSGKREVFSDLKSGRWVKIRSLKYLKALVGGRWIVSDEWLQACAEYGGYVKEVNYEADGYWKGRRIIDAVKRSRLRREKLLQLSSPDVDRSTVGTMLFADFCFHIIGEFLPPMPPATDLETLICMGGGKLIALIPDETRMRENRARKLIIVSDKINPIALRQQTRQLKAQPQMKAISSAIIVNYLWVINSISEAKLRELP